MQTSEQPRAGPSSDNLDLKTDLNNIWNRMKTYGEPRIVVSMIGAYNELTQNYEPANNSLLKEALNHVARLTGSKIIYQCIHRFHSFK